MSLAQLSDENLMKLYQQGEYLAFEQLYARYRQRIFSFVQVRIYDKNLVEEVFQNIFLKFHQTKALYSDKYLVGQWIFTISKSVIIDSLRKEKNLKNIDYNFLNNQDENTEVEINLSGLIEREKNAIELKFFNEKSYDEIAEILKTNPTNVRKIISRAISKLKGLNL